MTARALNIEGRRRPAATSTASLDDFVYREGRPLAAEEVLDSPDVSLYCLDPKRERAIFVRAPSANLLAAPFYYDAQYRCATELFAVPYEKFIELANTITFPTSRLIFVYSTGRCGSTLVSHAFRRAERVISLSEPDVFTQLASFYADSSLASSQLRALADASLKLLHPCATRDVRLRCCALKFRGSVIAISEMLHALAPAAQVIFLYRDLMTWVRSCARSLRSLESSRDQYRPDIERIVRRILSASLHSELAPAPLPPLDLLVCSWVAAIQQCRHLQLQGVRLLSSTYASLERAPAATLTALLGYCDLHVTGADLGRLIELDAQADTALARAAVESSSSSSVNISDAQIRELLHRYAPDLTPDYTLPGIPGVTMRPSSC